MIGENLENKLVEIINQLQGNSPEAMTAVLGYIKVDAQATLLYAVIWMIAMAIITLVLWLVEIKGDCDGGAFAFSILPVIGFFLAFSNYMSPTVRASVEHPEIGLAARMVESLENQRCSK
jgi:hypothetical protein